MKKTALFLALLAFCPARAEAAELKGTELPAIVVTASRIEEKATRVTQAVTVIPEEEIRKNQHQEIGGLLRQYGLQVDSYTPNSSLSQTSIRGMRSDFMGSEMGSAVLILIDGRRSGTSNISLLPLVNVERIEILRGPAAVQYGTSAMGGVVNIITRRGTDETTAMAELGAGSFETFRSQGEVAGKLDGFDYSLGASYLTSDDYKTGSGWRYGNTSVGRKVGYNANLGYTFFEEHRIGLTALGVDMNDMGAPNDVRYHDLTAHNDRRNYSFDGLYEGGTEAYGLGWKARYFTGRDNFENWEPDNAWSQYHQSRTDYQGAQGQLSFTKELLTLTGGLDWAKHDVEDSNSGDSNYKNTGVFMLAKLSFMEELIVVSGGVRYDDYKLEISGGDNNFNKTVPSVGIAVNPLDWLTLRANYGESFVMPTTMQFFGFSTWNYLPNPNLKPEKGKGWDAGLDLRYKSLNFGATYFQTDYKDKIVSREVALYTYQYQNEDVKFKGIEAQAGVDIGELLDWRFTLRPYASLTRMLEYEDSDGNKVPNVSKLDLAYGVGFNHPAWGLDADLRFTYFGEVAVNSTDSIGGRTTADLYITQAFYRSEKLGTFSVKAELRNIFDKDYYLIKEYPMPGRSFWLGLRYDY